MAKNTQVGSVLVFRPGVTKEQAEQALQVLIPLLEEGYYIGNKPYIVEEFNPEYGGPVWYVP